ncbi:MAG TPA: phosphoribosylanthranilate isomerase [Burkholderiales bacterium]|nr:phosphoribosylanthranilate isomerase [Burkholderiales bacterium]
MATAVKICGITRVEDALAAARAGAHAIGLVFAPGSPRLVDQDRAAAIVRALPPFVTPVALFVDAAPALVRAVIEHVKPQLLQFHGAEEPGYCAGFGLPFLKAVRVRPGVDLLQYARHYARAQGLLLDAFVEGNHGGTGAVFDWSLIPRDFALPIVLAGGLDPGNVGEAVRRVRPWAVDVSSGVEASKGIKDAARIAAFIRGVRDADV